MTVPAITTSLDEPAVHLRHLTAINTVDLLTAFGVQHVKRGRALLEYACRLPAQRFARQVMAYDAAVGTYGLNMGGAITLKQFVADFTFSGQEHIPRSGPVLIAANHPGLCDTLALFAAISRPDLRIIAADRPFLRAIPNTMRYLYLADETPASRLGVVRASTRHLRQGGTVLTFPGGQIEPDPAVYPDAVQSIDRWPGHIEIFPRLIPDLTIVPAIVSGVLSPAALFHPLTRLRRQQKEREWLGATLQVIFRRYQNVQVHVAFGAPVRVSDFGGDAAAANRAVLDTARALIVDDQQRRRSVSTRDDQR